MENPTRDHSTVTTPMAPKDIMMVCRVLSLPTMPLWVREGEGVGRGRQEGLGKEGGKG